MSRSVIAIVVGAACLVGPAPARADGCCMTTALFGVGQLTVWERYAVGARLSSSASFGRWDRDGGVRLDGLGREGELRLEAFGLLRLTDQLVGFMSLPAVLGVRAPSGPPSVGAAFADGQLGLRYELLERPEAGAFPTVGIVATALFPTGRTIEDARARHAADASSRGAFGAGAALSLEKIHGPFFARLDAGGTVYGPVWRRGITGTQLLGPTLGASLTGGMQVLDALLLALTAATTVDLPYAADGVVRAGSEAWSTSLFVTSAWQLDGRWALTGSVGGSTLAPALGKNRPAQATVMIGVRYGG